MVKVLVMFPCLGVPSTRQFNDINVNQENPASGHQTKLRLPKHITDAGKTAEWPKIIERPRTAPWEIISKSPLVEVSHCGK